MNDKPDVDVVIAARNEERDLPGCLASLRNQSYPGAVRAFVGVDRRSRDRTAELAKALGAETVTGHEGRSNTRNAALAKGSAPLVAFIDAHSVASEAWIASLVKRLHETGAIGAQGSTHCRFVRSSLPSREDHRTGANEASAYAWLNTNNCLYVRAVVEELGGFDPKCISNEDVDLSWRALLAGNALAFSPEAWVTHTDRGTAWRHLSRSFFYGLGSGQLAARYELNGPPFPDWPPTAPRLAYWLGGRVGSVLIPLPRWSAMKKTRPWTLWAPGQALRPAPECLWWFSAVNTAVLVKDQQRCSLGGIGETFWRCLTRRWSREHVVIRIARASGAQTSTVAEDLDGWTQSLLSEGWLERACVQSEE